MKECCSDYKEYVKSLIEHKRFQEALRQNVTIDNFRSAAYLKEINNKKALIQKRISEIKLINFYSFIFIFIKVFKRKLEENMGIKNIKPKYTIKKYQRVIKKQSIKPNESAAIITINKRNYFFQSVVV